MYATNIKGCPLNKHEETTIEYTLLMILLCKYCKHSLSSVTKYNSSGRQRGQILHGGRYCTESFVFIRRVKSLSKTKINIPYRIKNIQIGEIHGIKY